MSGILVTKVKRASGLGGNCTCSRSKRKRRLSTAVVASALLVGSRSSAGAGVIYNLGVLAGTDTSRGYAINEGGQVVGYSHISGGRGNRAFLYSGTPGSGGTMANLGTLGGVASYAYSLNETGQVAGVSYKPDLQTRAFRYYRHTRQWRSHGRLGHARRP